MDPLSRVNLSDYETDKSPEYLANYASELGEVVDAAITILELGVQRGGSLLLWRDLFPLAQIAGLDLNPTEIDDPTDRIHIYKGYQQDTQVLDRIAAEVAPNGFDLIIDDASHLGQYTAQSFWHLFPRHLKAGGLYVIEDWECGYSPSWGDGHAFIGHRGALSDHASSARTNRAEMVRRRVRAAARPVARHFDDHSKLRAAVQRMYARSEGYSLQRRFPSHDFGTVGLVKQIIDASAIDPIDGKVEPAETRNIKSVKVTAGQIFVRKR